MAGETQIVTLRPATPDDYVFARRIHHAGMRWIGERLLGRWDDAFQDARFDKKFVCAEVRIVVANGKDAGYVQVGPLGESIELKEFHIDAPFQNRGIGSEVLRLLLAEARAASKPISVDVVEFNPARAFYARAGFQVIGRADHKLLMRHDGVSA